VWISRFGIPEANASGSPFFEMMAFGDCSRGQLDHYARVAWNRALIIKQFFELEPALDWLRNVISPAVESTLPARARFR